MARGLLKHGVWVRVVHECERYMADDEAAEHSQLVVDNGVVETMVRLVASMHDEEAGRGM